MIVELMKKTKFLTIGNTVAAMLAASFLTVAESQAAKYDCVIEPHKVVDIAASVDGILVEVFAGRGDKVTKGMLLARQDDAVQKASLNYARSKAVSNIDINIARNRVNLMKKEVNRARKLHRKNIVATGVLDKAQAELKQAQLQLSQAKHEKVLAQLDLARAQELLRLRTVRSPMDGIVIKRMLAPGEFAGNQDKIFKIVKIDPLFVEVYLPIAIYPTIKMGMVVDVSPSEPVGGRHKATISVVDKVFDAASSTFGVRLILPNPGSKLPAGVSCSVEFK